MEGAITDVGGILDQAFVVDDGWPLIAGAWLILIGSLLTLGQRLRSTRRWQKVEHR